MNNMTNEIMLLGVATLILSAIERDAGRLCSACRSAPLGSPMALLKPTTQYQACEAKWLAWHAMRPCSRSLCSAWQGNGGKFIEEVCCAVSSKAYAGMTWLDRVEGCACCLSNTENVSPCYLQAKGCQSADTLDGCCNDSYDLNSAEGQVNALKKVGAHGVAFGADYARQAAHCALAIGTRND